MPKILVYAGTWFKYIGPRKKLEHIEFAEICEAEQFDETFERASKVSEVVGIVKLDDPMTMARIAAYGVSDIINEPK